MNELEQVYRKHRQGLFSLALSVTGSTATAEDAIHEAFIRLFKRNQPLDEKELVGYVFRAVRNSAIDFVRSSKRRSNLRESLFESKDELHESAHQQDTLASQERITILQNAIDELEDREREAVVLKALAGLSYEQISEIVGAPAKTVASRYRRSLVKLEEKMRGRL